jgi:two-component system, NtrC family, sensor kinase
MKTIEKIIARLAEYLNGLTAKHKRQSAELVQKPCDPASELATIDAVALTLSEAGNLTDVLARSLDGIINSLSGLKPRGGVFLCDPDGEVLHLATHKGLSSEFARHEDMIRMGECLCGMVARTGELLFTQDGCSDPRHARTGSGENHGHIIIPMKSRGIVLGVMFLYTSKDFTLKPIDVRMLDAIGAQLGLAVENFRFYTEVKQSSEKYWDLFENARDILFTMDTGCRFTAVNRTTEQFTGYSKIELIGKDVKDFLTPESVAMGKELLGAEEIKSRRLIEFEVIKRDTSRAFLEVSLRKLFKDQVQTGFQVSARDITEQRNLRAMIVQAERLGAIGQVSVAVRHEINNPLTTVIGNVELLIERYEHKDKELTARLEVILNNALRIAEITKRLQEIKKENIVDYRAGVKMTDLK